MGLLDKLKKNKAEKDSKQEELLNVVKENRAKRAEKKKTKSKKPATQQAQTPAGSSAPRKETGAYRVLLHPQVSEKATAAEVSGRYTFIVARDADKVRIKDAVQAIYGVRPVKVRTINMNGKQVRFGWREGRRSDWKKAVVILPKGKSITIHEGT